MVPGGRGRAPAGRVHRRPAGDLGVVRPGRRGGEGRAEPGAPAAAPAGGDVRISVRGTQDRGRPGFDPTTQRVSYTAGALLLDPLDVTKVLDRTAQPILVPETEEERIGTVGNVVFPTAIEEVDGVHYVFYGMADAKIGVARLDRIS